MFAWRGNRLCLIGLILFSYLQNGVAQEESYLEPAETATEDCPAYPDLGGSAVQLFMGTQTLLPFPGVADRTVVLTILTFVAWIIEPATAATYPHQVVHTAVDQYISLGTIYQESECPSAFLTEGGNATHYTTFTAFESESTYMTAASSRASDMPCSGTEEEFEPVDECTELGAYTGCLGQCQESDGVLLCPQNPLNHYQMGIGRVCWLANNTGHALFKPCLDGDIPAGCVPREGRIEKYNPYKWI